MKTSNDMNGRERFYQWVIGTLVAIIIFMGGQRYGETALKIYKRDIDNNDIRLVRIEEQLPTINKIVQEIKDGQVYLRDDFKDLLTELRKEVLDDRTR